MGKKVIKLDTRDGSYREHDLQAYLPDEADVVEGIAVDSSGNIWVTTNREVLRYDGIEWNVMGEFSSAGPIVVAPSGDIWVNVYYKGVARYDGSGWTFYTAEDGLAGDRTTDIAVDHDGNIWVGTSKGVSFYDGGGWTNWWGARSVRTKEFELGKNHTIIPPLDGVYRLTVDGQDRVWVWGYGLVVYDGNWKWVLKPNYEDRGEVYVWKDNMDIYTMAVDRFGHLWVNELSGIRLYDFDRKEVVRYDDYNTSGAVVAGGFWGDVKVDGLGNIWVATLGGISMFQPSLSVKEGRSLPLLYYLKQNIPNPFNSFTTIQFYLPKASEVKLSIYDVLGRPIRELVRGTFGEGLHSVFWDGKADDGSELASGVYLVRMDAGGFNKVRKVVLVR